MLVELRQVQCAEHPQTHQGNQAQVVPLTSHPQVLQEGIREVPQADHHHHHHLLRTLHQVLR